MSPVSPNGMLAFKSHDWFSEAKGLGRICTDGPPSTCRGQQEAMASGAVTIPKRSSALNPRPPYQYGGTAEDRMAAAMAPLTLATLVQLSHYPHFSESMKSFNPFLFLLVHLKYNAPYSWYMMLLIALPKHILDPHQDQFKVFT